MQDIYGNMQHNFVEMQLFHMRLIYVYTKNINIFKLHIERNKSHVDVII